MRKQITLLFCAMCFFGNIYGQIQLSPTVISSGGGIGVNDNLSISWTLGEVAVTTLTGDQLILTQGFQQSFDMDVGIAMEELNWNISIYPNPVRDELRILFNIENTGDFLLEIQDVAGRLIKQELHKGVNPGDMVVINTSSYTNGIYYLKVFTPDHQQIQVSSLLKL